jgi:hypothetical protein
MAGFPFFIYDDVFSAWKECRAGFLVTIDHSIFTQSMKRCRGKQPSEGFMSIWDQPSRNVTQKGRDVTKVRKNSDIPDPCVYYYLYYYYILISCIS